jgi:hypothetical protein
VVEKSGTLFVHHTDIRVPKDRLDKVVEKSGTFVHHTDFRVPKDRLDKVLEKSGTFVHHTDFRVPLNAGKNHAIIDIIILQTTYNTRHNVRHNVRYNVWVIANE